MKKIISSILSVAVISSAVIGISSRYYVANASLVPKLELSADDIELYYSMSEYPLAKKQLDNLLNVCDAHSFVLDTTDKLLGEQLAEGKTDGDVSVEDYYKALDITGDGVVDCFDVAMLRTKFKDDDYISEFFGPDTSVITYTSPNGEFEIKVEQYSNLLSGHVTFYNVSDSGDIFLYTCDTDDGYTPFDENGEWTTDSDGNSVFTNNESYKITWYDNSVEVEFMTDYLGVWDTQTFSL
jgi:hypothetical protein